MTIATLIDISGIQSYIFGSNRLRENIGASYLVAHAIDRDSIKRYLQSGTLIYQGGGNAMLQFNDLDAAKAFTRTFTRDLLTRAPGLNIAIAHHDFSEQDSLKDVRQQLEQKIAQKKRRSSGSAPLLGLGITATCNSTQFPAIAHTSEMKSMKGLPKHDHYLVSREVKAKLEAVEDANKQLKQACELNDDRYLFPYDVDDMGRNEGTSSYMAIVHIDGNGMGERFIKYSQRFDSNEDYIAGMGEMSDSVEAAGKKALKSILDRLVQTIDSNPELRKRLKPANNKQHYLPFRPLVYGGDDITFICDGRLGLSLATAYLQALQAECAADKKKIYACAGVCIVKTHYPFARAYQMSEDLCSSAKKFMRDRKSQGNSDLCAIDWHITSSGLLGKLEDIRSREYTTSHGSLHIRPMPIEQQTYYSDWHYWNAFATVVKELNEGDDWRDRRNKVIALRDILREEENATKQYLNAYRLPNLPTFVEDREFTGWTDLDGNHVSPYFDAIEAMEFYTPLSEPTA